MPAKSKTQRNLMGMALAYKRGTLDVSGLPKGLVARIKNMAKTMSEKELEDYASTKNEGLPKRKKYHKGTPVRIKGVKQ